MTDRTVQNRLEYVLFRASAAFIRRLPRSAALAFGRGLGSLARLLQPGRERIARENLAAAFPQMSAEERNRAIGDIFRHLGASAVELLLLDTWKGREDLERFVTLHGTENLEAAFAHGRGVIILTGHIGFWEIGTFVLPTLGYPVDFVAKRMKNRRIENHIRSLREAAGGQVIESHHGARRIVRSLNRNRAVALLLDQHTTPRRSIRVPFFGRPAWTTPIITEIAMRRGVPVVPCFSRRLDDDRYEIEIQKPLIFDDDPAPEAVAANTALLTAKIEAAVRRDLTQWFWVHRRWRD